MTLVRRFGSPRAIREAGVVGLELALLEAKIGFQKRTLGRVLEWAQTAPDPTEDASVHQRITNALGDDRQAKQREIVLIESDLAELLAQTPYILLLSIVGVNVVSVAEFAGEMGPIGHYASSRSITRRARLVPSRYQSDQVDRKDGPLVRQSNCSLRQAILTIAGNLMMCNDYFRGLSAQWRKAGKVQRHSHVKAGERFCLNAYHMVASGRVFKHPACQRRDYILNKLIKLYCEHVTSISQAQARSWASHAWRIAARRVGETGGECCRIESVGEVDPP